MKTTLIGLGISVGVVAAIIAACFFAPDPYKGWAVICITVLGAAGILVYFMMNSVDPKVPVPSTPKPAKKGKDKKK